MVGFVSSFALMDVFFCLSGAVGVGGCRQCWPAMLTRTIRETENETIIQIIFRKQTGTNKGKGNSQTGMQIENGIGVGWGRVSMVCRLRTVSEPSVGVWCWRWR